LASLGVSLEGRGFSQGDSVDWVHLFVALLPGRSCPLGRDCGMISFRRRLDLYQRLLDNNKHCRVMRILLFGQRARRRSTREVDRVPSLGPRHRERALVGRREI
jgi:hypothetical protein